MPARGWLSRRLERQCDVFAAWTASGSPDDKAITPTGAVMFASALGRIADLNGVPASQRSWRHGSIQSRIDVVCAHAEAGRGRADIDRLVRRVTRGLWLGLIGGIATLTAMTMLAGD